MITPKSAQVRLFGPRRILDKLELGADQVYVDLDGLPPGEHSVDLKFNLPAEIKVAERKPAHFKVKISKSHSVVFALGATSWLKSIKQKRRLFGTDGVRGIANQEPMTSEMALKLGRAIAKVLHDPIAQPTQGSGRSKSPSLVKTLGGDTAHRYKILIGKDTRLSGYMLETALASGICSMGADVQLVGPLPTPAVAFLTRTMRADAGVVISASHNPYQDNGIKFFSFDGFKLPDEVEARMEEMIFSGEADRERPTASQIGKAFRISDAVGRYNVFVKNSFPRHLTLEGLRIVVDCGHGAAYRVVPEILSELGAQVIPIGVHPDGENINHRCGALYPETARDVLLHEKADFAVSLDGDADRAIFIDETGEVLDGDQVLAICAKDMQEKGTLKGRTVVATVMSNLGLDLGA